MKITQNEKNLITLLERQASEKSAENFLAEIKSGIRLSYSEFYQQVKKCALFLSKSGIQEKDKVGLMLGNGIDFIVDFFAVLHIGAIVIPVNPAFKDRELDYILSDANIRFLIVERRSGRSAGIAGKKASVPINPQTELIELSDRCIEDKRQDNLIEDTALILYTSGSTGNAKGVMLTHKNLLKEMSNIKDAHELTSSDRVLCILPWFHINGLVITMLTPLLVGHKIVIAEKFSSSRFWQWVDEYGITWFSGVPTVYTYLLEGKSNPDKNTLRFARSASSSLSTHVLDEFEKRFHVMIIESYGMTEGGSQLTSNPMPPKARKKGSVGLPYGLEVRIVNDDGKCCEPFESGEVQFRGESITGGYYKKEKETLECFEGDWLKTGDIGYLDKDKYLFLNGRKKELINRSGEKFSPREIEEVLYQYPGIKLAAVVGVPDKTHGEAAAAFCVENEGMTISKDKLLAFCERNLVKYKIPKEIFFVDKLPLSANGKVQRLKLIEVYEKNGRKQK